MRYSDAAKLISLLSKKIAILVIGPPGVGKTSLAHEVGRLDKADRVVLRDLACHLPEDLLGLPYRIDGVSHYAAFHWITALRDNYTNVLILDDLGAADQAVQKASFRLIQERETGSCKFSEGTRIIATSNRREDKSGASLLPAALRNKMIIISIEPDILEWSEWARNNNVSNDVISFLNFKPSLLSTYAVDADANGAFATPRSWANLGTELHSIGQDTLSLPFELSSGFVGEGAAREFLRYLSVLKQFPDPKSILLEPEKVLPSPPKEADVLVALVSTLGEIAGSMRVDDPKISCSLVKALAHVTQSNNEYASTGFASYIHRGGSPVELQQAVKQCGKDTKLKRLVNHLASSHAAEEEDEDAP